MNIQLEFCSNGSLDRVIANSAFRGVERRAWMIMRGTVEGLRFIHENLLIHRDIKPVR